MQYFHGVFTLQTCKFDKRSPIMVAFEWRVKMIRLIMRNWQILNGKKPSLDMDQIDLDMIVLIANNGILMRQ